MPSIGNDIVDLTLPENRGKSADWKFIKRVFTSDEEKVIQKASNPDVMLWSIWACKEAAYKAAVKKAPLSFLPRHFAICVQGEEGIEWGDNRGWIRTPIGEFCFRLTNSGGFVHSLVYSEDLSEEQIICKIWPLAPGDESKALYGQIISFLSAFSHFSDGSLKICRPRLERGLGPPVLLFKGKRVDVDLSLSHDGKWGAFASVLDI